MKMSHKGCVTFLLQKHTGDDPPVKRLRITAVTDDKEVKQTTWKMLSAGKKFLTFLTRSWQEIVWVRDWQSHHKFKEPLVVCRLLVLSGQQFKIQRYSIYNDIKQRKSANPYLWETGSRDLFRIYATNQLHVYLETPEFISALRLQHHSCTEGTGQHTALMLTVHQCWSHHLLVKWTSFM